MSPYRHDLAWSRILLVEGTAGVGESTLLDALVRRYVSEQKPLRTLLHLSQAHTFGPLVPGDDDGTLTAAACVTHAREVVRLLAWPAHALTDERKPKFHALVDTLHLTHCVRPGVVAWPDVRDVDAELAALGARLVLLHARPETLWQRGIVPRRDTQFMQYARRFGGSLEEIHAYFVREQAELLRLSEASQLETLRLDGDATVDDCAARAFSFWMR